MNYPLVSVVINTHNRCQLVIRAINSALNQTYPNIEIIVIDANSNDNTREVVNSIEDKRIIYFFSPNSDFSYCVNTGFKIAKGKYVALLDDDDEWLPNKLEKQIELFEKLDSSYGWVGCGEEYWDDRENISLGNYIPYSRGDVFLKILSGMGGGTAGSSLIVVRKEVIDNLGGFIEEVKFSTDLLFYLKLSTQYKFDYVEEVLCLTHCNHIYQNERASLMKMNRKFISDKIEVEEYVLKQYKEAFDQYPKYRYIYYRNLARMNSYLRNYRQGYKYLICTLRSDPSKIKQNIRLILAVFYYCFFKLAVRD
ncbi:MAG TPA: glycosyltransferase family 2 protein [Candidatus Cloacimonadota bacterium]|nr:glycosyltransferase family 2 protein [Candidatus Cloacimonadota bacterium]